MLSLSNGPVLGQTPLAWLQFSRKLTFLWPLLIHPLKETLRHPQRLTHKLRFRHKCICKLSAINLYLCIRFRLSYFNLPGTLVQVSKISDQFTFSTYNFSLEIIYGSWVASLSVWAWTACCQGLPHYSGLFTWIPKAILGSCGRFPSSQVVKCVGILFVYHPC